MRHILAPDIHHKEDQVDQVDMLEHTRHTAAAEHSHRYSLGLHSLAALVAADLVVQKNHTKSDHFVAAVAVLHTDSVLVDYLEVL